MFCIRIRSRKSDIFEKPLSMFLIFFFQNEDGSWPRDDELKSASDQNEETSVSKKGGKCGLHNLGNTCFMASGIQCLAAVVPLANHFLNPARWESELNLNNPLGIKGIDILRYKLKYIQSSGRTSGERKYFIDFLLEVYTVDY